MECLNIGTKIVTSTDSVGFNQRFKAYKANADQPGFQLAALHAVGGCVDHNYKYEMLCLGNSDEDHWKGPNLNRQFVAEEVFPCTNIVRIRSMHDSKSFHGRGVGNQVSLEPSAADAHQFWKIILMPLSTTTAFKHGDVYNIISVFDGHLLTKDLDSNNLVAVPKDNDQLQMFTAFESGNGFRLCAKRLRGSEFDPSMFVTEIANQRFVAEEMFGGTGIVRIRSLESGNYFRNNGIVNLKANPRHNEERVLWRLNRIETST